MILYDNQVVVKNGNQICSDVSENSFNICEGKKNTIAYGIFKSHNTSADMQNLKIKFDCLASHDITYVGIIQTARASGLEKFPIPYVMTNCHNSLCAVGGTINEDDHLFGLSAAKKYGGIYVPTNVAVIHSFMRERFAGCGKMILGSDSHTRYGALGTMAIGEGGPEVVKQLLDKTYDIAYPKVVAVVLKGNIPYGVGPQDVALSIIGKVFDSGFVKNKVLEFIGDGVDNLSMDFRNAIDVMTTETTCLTSIWKTDDKTKAYLKMLGRESDYKKLEPAEYAIYDSAIEIDLSKIVPMIAMPFHPSNVYKLSDVIDNPYDILSKVEKQAEGVKLSLCDKIKDNKVHISQGIIAGCAGGNYESIAKAARILSGENIGSGEFSLSVYAGSQAILVDLLKKGYIEDLTLAGAIIKPSFCGPCFGAGDVPSNNAFSIRHTTRNFPNREGSKPNQNQIASVALMDALSIAATAKNGGVLTSATDIDYDDSISEFEYTNTVYDKRVYNGFEMADNTCELKFGPNIADWPEQIALTDNILIKVVSAIYDQVTTTDELIPSGETSSYRSNPLKLAEFTLSRKDPDYVMRAKQVLKDEKTRQQDEFSKEYVELLANFGQGLENTTSLGSAVFAKKPGDGSAREQAASCQRVLGGNSNIAHSYATKRYRSNLINWGMLPFTTQHQDFEVGDYIFVPNIKMAIENNQSTIEAKLLRNNTIQTITLSLGELTQDERQILLDGCLINYYKAIKSKQN